MIKKKDGTFMLYKHNLKVIFYILIILRSNHIIAMETVVEENGTSGPPGSSSRLILDQCLENDVLTATTPLSGPYQTPRYYKNFLRKTVENTTVLEQEGAEQFFQTPYSNLTRPNLKELNNLFTYADQMKKIDQEFRSDFQQTLHKEEERKKDYLSEPHTIRAEMASVDKPLNENEEVILKNREKIFFVLLNLHFQIKTLSEKISTAETKIKKHNDEKKIIEFFFKKQRQWIKNKKVKVNQEFPLTDEDKKGIFEEQFNKKWEKMKTETKLENEEKYVDLKEEMKNFFFELQKKLKKKQKERVLQKKKQEERGLQDSFSDSGEEEEMLEEINQRLENAQDIVNLQKRVKGLEELIQSKVLEEFIQSKVPQFELDVNYARQDVKDYVVKMNNKRRFLGLIFTNPVTRTKKVLIFTVLILCFSTLLGSAYFLVKKILKYFQRKNDIEEYEVNDTSDLESIKD